MNKRIRVTKSHKPYERLRRFYENKNGLCYKFKQFKFETPDDVLDELSNYVIDGLDFTGTKYE